LPVFNGAKDLQSVLESLTQQTFKDFELIISDNASTDSTENICREYARRDERIRYIRQSRNYGAGANFQYVLNEAQGKYFMWAAADDIRSLNFLEINHNFLERHPDYVCSTSPVKFEGSNFNPISMGDASLNGNQAERIGAFMLGWHANGRFYSLMRTSLLKDCPYITGHFLGADWAVMLYLISQGKTYRHSDGCVVLGRYGFSNCGTTFKYFRKSWIHWFLPFFELNGVVFNISKNFPIPHKALILKYLLILNFRAVYASAKSEIKKKLIRF